MVHHLPQAERSPRKRDRRTAGLPSYGSPALGETNVGELSLVSVPGSGGPLGEIQPPPPKMGRLSMYDTYQPWVLQTYGDQAKTKTITRNKYQRILQILRGDYIDNESSKFKLWVKGRGFRIGPPPGYYHPTLMDSNIGQSTIDYNPDKDPCPDIYVQTGTIKDAEGNDRICFKKVAIVEDFFEIVYNLHVCRDGKELKHMGQKRTYRAVSERYAFVPREAVTKFLVLCTECPRRSSGVPASLNNLNNKSLKVNNKNIKATTSNNVTPPAITTSLGPYTTHLGTPLLRSPLLRVTHSSNHPAMILNSSQATKRKNNFSSVVSLVGNNDENGSEIMCSAPPPSIHIGRNGTFTFTPTPTSEVMTMSMFHHHQQQQQQQHQHHSFGNKRLGLTLEDMQMTPLHQTSLLQPLPTTVSTTPPPSLNLISPPRVVKTEPFTMPLTPETPRESSHTPVEIPELNLNLKEEKEPLEEDEEPVVYREEEPVDYSEQLSALSTEVDFTLPITTLYMKHIKNKKKERASDYDRHSHTFRDCSKMAESEGSEDELKNVVPEKRFDQRATCEWTPYSQKQQHTSSAPQQDQPLSLSKSDALRRSPCGSPGTNERTGSATPHETASNAEETSSNGNKDEDDDDNDDDNDDEKMDAQYDPERLKAFNMFVRLFVDENLDRIVPISKQPKEKIQAIIDACARQFPEFADRTRKRIRTYLKSCRRNKRTRDSNGWENSRPTPPHLTSIQAEQILATACENEAQNAKRMRLGLEPVSQPNPLAPQPTVTQSHLGSDKALGIVETSSVSKMDTSGIPTSTSHSSALAKALERPLGGEPKVMNGNNIFQSSFHNNYQKVSTISGGVSHPQQGVAMLLPSGASNISGTSPVGGISSGVSNSSAVQMVTNGPTDLSLKGTAAKASPRPSLNAVEVAAVRQLITGYRESAAFLLRSADELENLLVHQQNP